MSPRSFAAALLGLLAMGVLPSPASAQTTPKRYIAFGDSITFGIGDDPARARLGYPPRLENRLQAAGMSATVFNFGEPGEKTPEGLARLESIVLPQSAPGDVLLLMEGTNDISRSIGIETTMFDLGRMADLAEARSLSVVHATVIPRYPEANRDADNTLTDQLNGRIRDLAGRSLRRLADPNEVFRNTTGLFAGFYSTVKPDPVGHPNAAGYELLARVFSDVILGLDNVSPVPGIVDPVPGARNVRSDIPINVDVWDFGTGIDVANTFLLVNGLPVSATPVGDSRRVHLAYESLAPLTGTVIIGLRSRDLATPPNMIDRTISSFTVRGGTSVLQGDLNLDNRVDGTDLVRLGRSFGSVIGDAAYNANADFNADGRIDGQDLAVLASNFGRTSAGS